MERGIILFFIWWEGADKWRPNHPWLFEDTWWNFCRSSVARDQSAGNKIMIVLFLNPES